jgi:hypothetical protein
MPPYGSTIAQAQYLQDGVPLAKEHARPRLSAFILSQALFVAHLTDKTASY